MLSQELQLANSGVNRIITISCQQKKFDTRQAHLLQTEVGLSVVPHIMDLLLPMGLEIAEHRPSGRINTVFL